MDPPRSEQLRGGLQRHFDCPWPTMVIPHSRRPVFPAPSVARASHRMRLFTPPEFAIVIVSPLVVVLHDCERSRVPSGLTLKHWTFSMTTGGGAPHVSVAVALNETGAEGGGIVAGVGT